MATQEEEYADSAHPSKKYHEKSHGESFLVLVENNLHPKVYIFLMNLKRHCYLKDSLHY